MVKKSKKNSIFRTTSRKSRKSKLIRGGDEYRFSKPVIDQSSKVTYKDPIFDETITYSTKCSDNKDEEYRQKREAWVKALKDMYDTDGLKEHHPCIIGTKQDTKRPSREEIEECEKNHPEYKDDECKFRIPTQAQINECNRQRKEVIDEPCGEFISKTKCIAGNAAQNGITIRRFRGEPVRIKNQHLKETDETQNYDEFGETKVSTYCDKYKQKYCEADRIPVDTSYDNKGAMLKGSWAQLQKKNFKCAKIRQTGMNNTCLNGWTEPPGCMTHSMEDNESESGIKDLEEPSRKVEMGDIQKQLDNVRNINGGYRKMNRRFSRKYKTRHYL